jgi:hypothetical protein
LHQGGTLLGAMDYEAFLDQGDTDFDWPAPDDEFNPIALNYTLVARLGRMGHGPGARPSPRPQAGRRQAETARGRAG